MAAMSTTAKAASRLAGGVATACWVLDPLSSLETAANPVNDGLTHTATDRPLNKSGLASPDSSNPPPQPPARAAAGSGAPTVCTNLSQVRKGFAVRDISWALVGIGIGALGNLLSLVDKLST
jgi:hypothetical protein